jgi:hypothetical protein
MGFNLRTLFSLKRKDTSKSDDSDSADSTYDESYFAESTRIGDQMFELYRIRGGTKRIPMRGHVFGMSEKQSSDEKTTE